MNVFYHSSLIFQIVTGTLPILFVIFLKRKLPVEFVILLSASVITTLILYITAMLGIKNWLFWNLYKIIDIVCITIFYYSLLDSKKVKIIVLSIGSLCVTSIIWELSYFELVNKTSPILVLGKVLYTILFLIENLGKKASPNFNAYLLISLAILIYNSFKLFLSFEVDIFLLNNFWNYHNFIEGTSKLVIAYAILKLPKRSGNVRMESLGVNP
jgi:hypothetical protein